MEMQPVQKGQDLCLLLQILQGGAQTGTGRAGIIDAAALLGGALGIDPKPYGLSCILCPLPVQLHLAGRIKYNMIRISKDLGKFLLFVGGRKYMGLFAEGFLSKPRLIQPAGCGSCQIFS